MVTGRAVLSGDPNHYVRRFVREEQAGLCAVCEMPEWWEGMSLVFVLDHVDGDASNNERANLRLVCPNCDSQLPTYKARNRGRGRHARRARYAAGKSY